MGTIKKALKVLAQSYTDPEREYEMDERNEPGFDPGPEREMPKEAVEEMENDIISILWRNIDDGFTRDDLFKQAVRIKDYEKYDLDEYDIWSLFWDVLSSLVDNHQVGTETEVVELFYYY